MIEELLETVTIGLKGNTIAQRLDYFIKDGHYSSFLSEKEINNRLSIIKEQKKVISKMRNKPINTKGMYVLTDKGYDTFKVMVEIGTLTYK